MTHGYEVSLKFLLSVQMQSHLLLNCIGSRSEGCDGVGAAEQRDDAATLPRPLVLRVWTGHTANEGATGIEI